MNAPVQPMPLERLSMNLATVREQWNLEQAVAGCTEAGIATIAPWRDQLERCGIKRAARLIRACGVSVSSLCRGGFFPYSGPKERRAAIDDNRRAVEQAAAIGAGSLVLVCGGLPGGSKDIASARSQVEELIAETLPEARSAGIPLAIEPLHPMYAADRSCVNTLAQANDLCDLLGEGVGVVIDLYHVWWDPRLAGEIARAGDAGRILGLHLCDWLVPTRDLANDRGMMGDGIIDIPLVRGWVDRAGYEGACEVEIFSALNWWKRPAPEVLEVVKQRFVSVC